MESMFKSVLHEDEKIVSIEKSKKSSYVLAGIKVIPTILLSAFFCLMFGGPFVAISSQIFEREILGCILIVLSVWVGINLISLILRIKASLNYFVCLTDKRIIIRKGTFTNDFSFYNIESVTGNITMDCKQSIYDSRNGENDSCSIYAQIELYPVGHGHVQISTSSVENGYSFAKEIEKVVKTNAVKINRSAKLE